MTRHGMVNSVGSMMQVQPAGRVLAGVPLHLHAAIEHAGHSSHCGHYVAYVRAAVGFHCCSDDKMSFIAEFPERVHCAAYSLLNSKAPKNPQSKGCNVQMPSNAAMSSCASEAASTWPHAIAVLKLPVVFHLCRPCRCFPCTVVLCRISLPAKQVLRQRQRVESSGQLHQGPCLADVSTLRHSLCKRRQAKLKHRNLQRNLLTWTIWLWTSSASCHAKA